MCTPEWPTGPARRFMIGKSSEGRRLIVNAELIYAVEEETDTTSVVYLGSGAPIDALIVEGTPDEIMASMRSAFSGGET